MSSNDNNEQSFLEASQSSSGGLLSEFFGFMRENAKWWLAPFLVVFGIAGILSHMETKPSNASCSVYHGSS